MDSLFCHGDSYHILLNSFNRATFSFKTTATIVVNKSALYEGICQFELSSICRPVGTMGGGLGVLPPNSLQLFALQIVETTLQGHTINSQNY